MKFTERYRVILMICAVGLALRILYALFFARYISHTYFNVDAVFQNAGDFSDWFRAIKNWVKTGEYTVDPNNANGYFSRMPGYALFIGLFYYIFNEPYYLYAIGYAQILLDSAVIFFIYRIYTHLFPQSRYKYIAPILYAFNPINIFWAPVLLSESLSVFLMMLAIYLYTCHTHKYTFFYIGLIIGFDILVRPQLGIFALVFFLVHVLYVVRHTWDMKKTYALVLFLSGIFLTYGLWPIRNYVFHQRVVLTHDISGIEIWGPDVSAYMEYIYSIQTNWEPQMSQIVTNQPFTINKKIAYAVPSDSADLAKAIYLSKHCGSGFSHWQGYWKASLSTDGCDQEIVSLFKKLQHHQVTYRPLHFWLFLPLQSLQKCLFKMDVYPSSSRAFFSLTSIVFLFRSFMILAGIAGSVFLLKSAYNNMVTVIFIFFMAWYLILCFGPPLYMRNIEIRYLLQADTAMLIPASYFFSSMLEKLNPTRT
ncbi:MAG: hypothetical protein JWO58_2688 [Chitinophagaceae bacterium]|nr:hypothetical protein [Chitinophagaceae bacterium]